jgi:hypothetical protein
MKQLISLKDSFHFFLMTGLNDSISYVSGQLLLINHIPLTNKNRFGSIKKNDMLNLLLPILLKKLVFFFYEKME